VTIALRLDVARGDGSAFPAWPLLRGNGPSRHCAPDGVRADRRASRVEPGPRSSRILASPGLPPAVAEGEFIGSRARGAPYGEQSAP
jgi:hypothetical protein